ncbi:dephospho-CoA kinase [Pedobacter sp. HMWF019]|uniref:dephospho-CoA kinase n=1 Tax=Pedobacter sp. HMWF019 TaxID=2056856 RepID=UPI000D3C133C|nr:dephospho-CoA kinase [Pedobacter sp. HMWF019]PTS99279.1 dephospho-CoA kinase [Pedobacter sp. HMWF019]
MLKIGITGGIGSGKTTICHIFETLGASVFYADDVAKQIMVTDPVLVAGVKDTFGEESYHQNGVLNNKYIAGIVFNDAAQLAKLNALVHPAVFRAFDTWVAQVPETCPYILKEAALLFESGSYKMCDKNILVTAPIEVRMARVMARDQVTQAQVKARMDKQYTDEQKLKMADFFMINDESSSVIEQVLHLHHQFLQIKD